MPELACTTVEPLKLSERLCRALNLDNSHCSEMGGPHRAHNPGQAWVRCNGIAGRPGVAHDPAQSWRLFWVGGGSMMRSATRWRRFWWMNSSLKWGTSCQCVRARTPLRICVASNLQGR